MILHEEQLQQVRDEVALMARECLVDGRLVVPRQFVIGGNQEHRLNSRQHHPAEIGCSGLSRWRQQPSFAGSLIW